MKAKNFGKNLSRIMKQLKMPQLRLAIEADITPAAVSQILNGKREPSLSSIIKILKVIPVSFETLVAEVKNDRE
jgi:transcriptional regulator with XRE-family HTH domain